MEHWLGLQLGVGTSRARAFVDIAERVADFPHAVAALTHGEITLEQARVIVKAPAWADHDLVEHARVCTVEQLRHIVNRYSFTDDLPAVEPPSAEADEDRDADDGAGNVNADEAGDRDESIGSDDDGDPPAADTAGRGPITIPVGYQEYLSLIQREDGSWTLSARLDADHGLLLDAALTEVRDALFRGGDHDVTNVDALMELATTRLETLPDHARRDRYRVYVHLRGRPRPDGAVAPVVTDPLGQPLPSWVAEMLLCDARLQPLHHDHDGRGTLPVALGRSQRKIPSHLRRLVLERDRGCRVPGCGSTRQLEVHHLRHWAAGGLTDPDNLVTLCRKHHRAHHRGELSFTGDPGDPAAFTVWNQHGLQLGHRPPPTDVEPPPVAPSRYKHPVGSRLDYRGVYLRPFTTRPCCPELPTAHRAPPPKRIARQDEEDADDGSVDRCTDGNDDGSAADAA